MRSRREGDLLWLLLEAFSESALEGEKAVAVEPFPTALRYRQSGTVRNTNVQLSLHPPALTDKVELTNKQSERQPSQKVSQKEEVKEEEEEEEDNEVVLSLRKDDTYIHVRVH